MSKLIKYNLADLYDLASGISSKPEQAGHGYPFCSFSTVFNNAVLPNELPDLMDTSEEERVTYSIKEGDVFLTRTSETVDELGMSSVAVKDYPDATYSGFLKRLRPKTNLTYPKYMAMFFRSKFFRKTMANKAVMTLRASFNEDIFNDIIVELPSMPEQIKIGDLFFDIEQKIRVNNSICSDLESMAKQIYDYWFVQFDFPDENGKPYKSSGGKMEWNQELKREIPDGWDNGNLYDIASFINGLACQKYRPIDERQKLPVVKITEMHEGITDKTEWVRDDIDECHIIDDGTILFSWSASLEIMLWNGGKAGLNQHIFKVEPKVKSEAYVYYQLSDYVINFVKMAEARKTTMGHITSEHLEQSAVIIPDEGILKAFDNKVCSVMKQITAIKSENRQLVELRDFLLPMFMNGQIKV